MRLITLQKTIQSMELALRQGIDSSRLVRKAARLVSLIKLEAETVGEEELIQATGQVLAYFETVEEGRLDLDEEGVSAIREFTTVFKDAIGDAAPGVRALDSTQLDEWNLRYQSLMARMKPIEEDFIFPAPEETEVSDSEIADLRASGIDGAAPALEVIAEVRKDEDVFTEEAGGEIHDPLPDGLVEEYPAVDFPDAEQFVPAQGHSVESGGKDWLGEPDAVEEPSVEELPPYNPAEEGHVRDVVIPDAEIKSSREFMELGEPKPEVAAREEKTETREPEQFAARRARPTTDRREEMTVRAPVQLEEIERLKRKLLELHEKQEMLSSKMSGILGGLKTAVGDEGAGQEAVSAEKLDIEDLEDLIFIGRQKG